MAKKQDHPGRPKLTAEVLDKIIQETIRTNDGLKKICERLGVGYSTIRAYIAEDEAFRERWLRARETGAQFMADEIIEISDESSGDYKTITNKNGQEIEVVDHENINRSRLRVDSRKWLLSKLLPKRYGDKVDHELSPVHCVLEVKSGTVTNVDV